MRVPEALAAALAAARVRRERLLSLPAAHNDPELPAGERMIGGTIAFLR